MTISENRAAEDLIKKADGHVMMGSSDLTLCLIWLVVLTVPQAVFERKRRCTVKAVRSDFTTYLRHRRCSAPNSVMAVSAFPHMGQGGVLTGVPTGVTPKWQ